MCRLGFLKLWQGEKYDLVLCICLILKFQVLYYILLNIFMLNIIDIY